MGRCLSRGNPGALAAPLLIVQVTRLSDGGQSNGVPYAFFDAGLSLMCLIVEAESRGLRAHPMAGWIDEPIRAELAIPADFQPTVVIAVGYEGDPATLEPALQAKESRPRVRKPLDEVLTFDRWPSRWSGSP